MDLPNIFDLIGRDQIRHVLEDLEKPSLLYFFEPDSNLSRLVNPSIQNVTENYQDQIELLAVNTEQNRDITYELNIMSSPTFLLFRDGSEIRRLTNIEYDNKFRERFQKFLADDFLFKNDKFDRLSEMNYFDSIKGWYGYNLVAFLKPFQTINWEIEEVMSELQDTYLSQLRIRLVNVEKDQDLSDYYDLKEFPSLLAIKDNRVEKKWEPVEDLEELKQECLDLFDSRVS